MNAPSCGCISVVLNKKHNPNGTFSDAWFCVDCNREFVKRDELDDAKAQIDSLRKVVDWDVDEMKRTDAELAAAQSELERHNQAAPLVLEYMKDRHHIVCARTDWDETTGKHYLNDCECTCGYDALCKALGVDGE